MAKKTTPAERKAFIEEQRARPSGYGAKAVFPRDMSFIDRKGNIVRPEQDHYRRLAKQYESQGRLMDASKAYRRAGDDPNATRVMQDYMGKRGYSRERLRGSGTGTGITALIALVAAIFFLSPNLTGNTIGNQSIQNSTIIGSLLLIVGLVAGFFWMKGKKK